MEEKHFLRPSLLSDGYFSEHNCNLPSHCCPMDTDVKWLIFFAAVLSVEVIFLRFFSLGN